MAPGASSSTDMTYGVPQQSPLPPTHPQRPIGAYGRSKRSAEQAIARATAAFGLQATIFRPRLIAGAGRLGILAKLFRLIERGLPVPMIGSGANRYQMVAVSDCVAAALQAVALDCPAGPFNLGSDAPPPVRDLLRKLIERAGSSSRLLPTHAAAVKTTLAMLDTLGLTLLHPEQYRIADIDYVLDTASTQAALGWKPSRSDADIIFEAYDYFAQASSGGSVAAVPSGTVATSSSSS